MLFLEISQNSQENIAVFSGEFCEISRNTFSYRPPPVATSSVSQNYFPVAVQSSVMLVLDA